GLQGEIFERRGRKDEALASYSSALSIVDDAIDRLEIRERRAALYLALGRRDEARADARLGLGEARALDHAAAIAAFEKILAD
ncbi:MAG TPA: hypothetical protein VFG69_04225, partial [Nannocystaceae bacterium]|nr:hypothetical protein [Nannocystaceae bacterium]